jgi:hypothetical protein
MSNKPHLRPHQEKRQASQVTRLIVAILIITVFALAIALELTGHVVFRGRLILASGAGSNPSRRFPGPQPSRDSSTLLCRAVTFPERPGVARSA